MAKKSQLGYGAYYSYYKYYNKYYEAYNDSDKKALQGDLLVAERQRGLRIYGLSGGRAS